MKLNHKILASLTVAAALSACNMPFAHAANAPVNDAVVGLYDHRVYPVEAAAIRTITQSVDTNSYTIAYTDGTTQLMNDSAGAQFAKLPTLPGFATSFITVSTINVATGTLVKTYASMVSSRYATCSAGLLSIGYGSTVASLQDGTNCAAFNAFAANSIN